MQLDIITAHEFASILGTSNTDYFILDVRNLDEFQTYNVGGTLIPLNELPLRIGEVPHNKAIIVVCRSGYRSHVAQEILKSAGYGTVRNLAGGLNALQREGINFN